MRILVTGGTGFLGQCLVRRLVAAGETVRVLVRRPSADRPCVLSGLEQMVGDLCDPPSLDRAVQGMDAVCHCAARMEVGGEWSAFEEVTVRGTEHLLEAACGEQVKRFLHVGSLGVYGLNGSGTITEDSPFDDNLAVRGHYTRAKAESERLVWKYARERGLPVTVVRPGLLYGPGRSPFVARVRIPLGSKLQIVVAQPDQRLPVAYIENVAEAIHLALSNERAIGKSYNVIDSEALVQERYLALLREAGLQQTCTIRVSPAPFYSLASICERVCRWLGVRPVLSRHQFERALASVHYDTSRAREELGWKPKIEIAEALRNIQGANI